MLLYPRVNSPRGLSGPLEVNFLKCRVEVCQEVLLELVEQLDVSVDEGVLKTHKAVYIALFYHPMVRQ